MRSVCQPALKRGSEITFDARLWDGEQTGSEQVEVCSSVHLMGWTASAPRPSARLERRPR